MIIGEINRKSHRQARNELPGERRVTTDAQQAVHVVKIVDPSAPELAVPAIIREIY